MSKAPFLTAAEELELLNRAHFAETEADRIAASNALVERNMGLIIQATRRTRRYGFTVEECLSVAVEAWLYSIKQYDFNGGRLSTYAVVAVKHKVSRWAGEQCGVVRVPACAHCRVTSGKAGEGVKKAVAAARHRALSTDWSSADGSGDDFPTIGQEIAFREFDGKSEDGPTLEEFNAAVNQLRGRLWVIISLRLENRTLEQIGFALGVTRERVRQLELKAREQLRKLLQRHYLNSAR
ncbi:MAG: hypothetical protein C0483_18630 [Pirellula sp.]|nr:hypothetical protein [Pirellula sp.]